MVKNILFTKRLSEIIDRKSITPADLSKKSGVSKGLISKYLNGFAEPKQDNLKKLADALDVSTAWLMGENVPQNKINDIGDIFPYRGVKVPMLGEIACGEPIYASEEHGEFVDTESPADFCLRCKGDSMINAKINNGDTVFLRRQDAVDNGEVAAVIIGDEVTLKRVYYYPDNDLMILKAENPLFKDMIFQGRELEGIKVIGKALYCQTKII